LIFLTALPLGAQETATLTVDASTVVNRFVPFQAFGTNVASWADPRPVQKKVQAAGNFLIRFPGGSWGDVYHWNGRGSYDAQGVWVPDPKEYQPGRLVVKYQPNFSVVRVHDGDPSTVWRSHPDTDTPHFQWILLDFGESRALDAVTVTWGDAAGKGWPIPAKCTVTYWDPASPRQWMPYSAPEDGWMETTARRNTPVKGGAQGIAFAPVTSRYLRLEMKEGRDGCSVAEVRG
jgi:hypothetical protein